MSERIKGQELEVMVIVNGQAQESISDFKDAEIAAQMEILREGYLGKTTDDRDDVYRGVRGRLNAHYGSADVVRLCRTIIDRARRRIAGVRISVKMRLNLPSGESPLILIHDVKFGEIPLGFSERTAFGTFGLEFEAPDFTVLGL